MRSSGGSSCKKINWIKIHLRTHTWRSLNQQKSALTARKHILKNALRAGKIFGLLVTVRKTDRSLNARAPKQDLWSLVPMNHSLNTKFTSGTLFDWSTWSQTMSASEMREISTSIATISGTGFPTIATGTLKMSVCQRSTATANSIKGTTLNFSCLVRKRNSKEIWEMSSLLLRVKASISQQRLSAPASA